MLDELVSVMNLKRFQAQEVVFEIGSEGDLFYFILDGAVEIRIPDQERKNDYQICLNSIFSVNEQI